MKRVLVAPLDWGLGHTARCIPLINELLSKNADVVFAGNKEQIKFAAQHFPKLKSIILFGYDVSYSAIWPQWVKVGFQSLRLKKIIERENKWLDNLLQKEHFDLVISDNRFGLYNSNVRCIFITHQLNIPSPLFKRHVNSINLSYVRNFDECWIPDDPEINLSGDLSSNSFEAKHIGLLSRFGKAKMSETKYDVVLLLSGTEPQRSILEDKLLELFKNTSMNIAIVRGVDGSVGEAGDNIETFGRLSAVQLSELMKKTECVVCRSGYSSIMDLVSLGKRMFLVPTPGQPEQEYLAQYYKSKWKVPFTEQSKLINCEEILNPDQYKEIPFVSKNNSLLQKEISRILSHLTSEGTR